MDTWTQTPSATPLQLKNWNARFWIMFNFWWSAGLVDGLEPHLPPLSSPKIEMFIFGLHSTSDDRLSDPSKKCWPKIQKNEKGPLSHQKIKCSFLDYVQLLMIGQMIWAKNIDQNAKKSPLSHWKMKCSFLDYIQLLMIGQAIRAKNIEQTIKKWKRPPKSLKNKMFIFGLCSTSDDQPSNLSNKHQPKH